MKHSAGVPAVRSALRIVAAVAGGQADGPVRGVARSLGLSMATCYRILCTLEQSGWVRTDDQKRRSISAGIVAELLPRSDWTWLLESARRPLEQLAARAQLAAKLSIREDNDAVTILRVESPRAMALGGRSGARFSLAFGSSGAMLCADLGGDRIEQIIDAAPAEAWLRQTPRDFRNRVAAARAKGIALDRGSYHPQVHTLSAPVVRQGKTLAAITLLGLPGDITDGNAPLLARELRRSARAISNMEEL